MIKIDSEGKLKRKFFSKFVLCHYLQENVKDQIHLELDRSSYENKISHFFSYYQSLTYKMNFHYKEQFIFKYEFRRILFKIINISHFIFAFALNIC